MKTTFTNKLLLSAGVAALAMSAGTAIAQTENVVATVTVQNTLTITEVDPLDFGIVAAISDAANTATLNVNALSNALTVSSTGAPAVFAVIDGTNATAANITIEDGADGAAINVTINNVVNPIFGGNAFTLGTWTEAWNGGAITARTAGTSFAHNFVAAFAAGVNTIDIGASLVTQIAVPVYTDGLYSGSFDVVFSY